MKEERKTIQILYGALENVISELEERAKMLKDDWELDGYNELVFAITKLKQVIADENHHTRHTTRNE